MLVLSCPLKFCTAVMIYAVLLRANFARTLRWKIFRQIAVVKMNDKYDVSWQIFMYIILTTKYNVAKYKMHVTYWRKLNCQHPSSKDIPGQSAGGKLSHNILANMYQRNLINEENNVACQKLDICRTGMCGCINKGATILVKALICLCCKQPRLAILPMSMSPLLKSFESNV